MRSSFTRPSCSRFPGARRLYGALLAAAVGLAATAAFAWTPLAVVSDPLVRQPGSQENDGLVIEPVGNCMTCHAGYNNQVEPGYLWKGSMMAQAARDPIFWATLTVAAQDSIWAAGRPNATDICLRCHTPPGWLGGRSDPTNGSALATTDFDGVTCDFCHSSYDPFHEATYAGTREGSDWLGYWDETGASATPSQPAANATLQADRAQTNTKKLFNGTAMYTPQWLPKQAGYTESAGGQYFVSTDKNRRASFADANPKHTMYYSRFHKSRYFCGTCHDVSNPVLANIAFKSAVPGDGTTVLPTEQASASSYTHVERTQSEFLLSGYGTGAGAFGEGPYAPAVFKTSRPGNRIAACQDCHMPDGVGVACNKTSGVLRPTNSVEHPKSGLPLHTFAGGNAFVPRLLASTVTGSPNFDAFNSTVLRQGPAILTLDLTQGEPMDPAALIAASDRAVAELQKAASVQSAVYSTTTGNLSFRIQNQTGHKLLTGYPEGRRMFVNIRAFVSGNLVREINPYDATASTLRGLDPAASPNSPPLGPNELYRDDLVYESRPKSSLTGEAHTLHFALATGREKDNRIPPKGFRIAEAAARLSEPVWNDASAPSYFSTAEYLGGYDDVTLTLPAGLEGIEIRVYYQSFSREYAEFLRNEIKGTSTILASPTPSGEPKAYVAQTDPFFSKLRAWGDAIWQVWDHNRTLPGEAPVLMASATVGTVSDPCAAPGSDGTPCNDGNLCTTSDHCASGACVAGGAVVCSALNGCHEPGVCNPSTGQCSQPLKPNGTTCSDSDACTQSDQCNAGVCVAGPALSCTASDECHVAGTCDSLTGLCSNPLAVDGTPCSAGTCSAGICLGVDASADAPVPGDAADEPPVLQDAQGPDAEEDDAPADGSGDDAQQDGAAGAGGSDAASDSSTPSDAADAEAKADAADTGVKADAADTGSKPDAKDTGADAVVKDSQVASDGTAGHAGASAEGGAQDAADGVGASDDGGCSCSTPGQGNRSGAAMAALGLMVVLRLRRRRRDGGKG